MAKKKEWKPLDLEWMPECRYIACDPSLSALGMVSVLMHKGQVYVEEAVTLKTEQIGDGGWDSNFDRAEQMYDMIHEYMADWTFDFGGMDFRAVHEAPPSGGGALMRTESSILAGREFRRAALDLAVPVDKCVTPQSHKKLITGNHIATKQIYAGAIKELLPRIHDSRLVSNEALRDALGIALYAAHRLGEERQA